MSEMGSRGTGEIPVRVINFAHRSKSEGNFYVPRFFMHVTCVPGRTRGILLSM